jgi:NADPH:quinone reductase-like Zn-dependent oxidoreductase
LTAEVPDGVTADVAASALLKGLTAHYLLKSVYPVQAGDTVLVHAGAGGVGLILTQWAHLLGVRVITTVSTPDKERLSRQAGADEVLPYPDDPAAFGERIRSLTDGAGVAAVYDGVGATTFDASLASLAIRGTRLGVSDPTVAGAFRAHRPGVQLAGRGIVRRNRRGRHHRPGRWALHTGRGGPRPPGSAGPQDGGLDRAAALNRPGHPSPTRRTGTCGACSRTSEQVR